MDLSIIVPTYKPGRKIEKFITQIKQQKDKKFEVVFVVDTNPKETLKIIEESTKTIKGPVKIIYNSKRTGHSHAVMMGVDISKGKNILVCSTNDFFGESMVSNIKKEIKKKGSNIIEFKFRFLKPIRWSPEIRKTFSRSVEIAKHREVLAFTFPFIFNKIFEKKLFKKVKKNYSLSKTTEKHSLELLFQLFLQAKTYSTSQLQPFKSKKTFSDSYNPFLSVRELDKIIKSKIYEPFKEELSYNKFFFESVVFSSIVGGMNQKHLITKYSKQIISYYQKSSFFNLNKYISKNTSEAKKLKSLQGVINMKAYKNF